jgi:hypothetical protein
VEAGGRRRKGQRLLYFFRTPPSVRVGREALDPEAVRLLEQHNPDVTFDWPRLLKSASAPPLGPPAGSPPPREERRRDRRDRRPQAGSPSTGGGAPVATDSTFARDATEPSGFTPVTDPVVGDTDFTSATDTDEDVDFAPATPLAEQAALTEAVEVAAAPDAANQAELVPPPSPEGEPPRPLPPVEARYARLGADGLARLRARYADVRSRLEGRPLDDAERVELLAKVERLNPDAWQTEHEVAHALEEYEVVFEALRPLVGRQPRSRRL